MSRLSAAVKVLASLADRFSDLPVVDAAVSRIYVRVELSVRDDLGDFEAWRSALGISPAQVVLGTERGGGPLMWLCADAVVDGVTVHLVGYGHVLEAATATNSAHGRDLARSKRPASSYLRSSTGMLHLRRSGPEGDGLSYHYARCGWYADLGREAVPLIVSETPRVCRRCEVIEP
ncbi:hypothetical protein [Streptomyces sp. MMS24-I29]|uniref:hypothetical protein n=1 Tax=Streptomyces sp. MMS24-I29 TaxID=3351480 RepID=UPI003C7BA1C5